MLILSMSRRDAVLEKHEREIIKRTYNIEIQQSFVQVSPSRPLTGLFTPRIKKVS